MADKCYTNKIEMEKCDVEAGPSSSRDDGRFFRLTTSDGNQSFFFNFTK